MAKPVNPRAFDSGLEVANRTLVRNTVVELLAPMLKTYVHPVTNAPEPGFLASIVKLDIPLENYDDEGLVPLLQGILGRTPAIAVAIGDDENKPAGIGGKQWTSYVDVHLYFFNNTMRSIVSRIEADVVSTGDTELDPPLAASVAADPGIDVAMQCAEELLIGEQPDTSTVHGVIKKLVKKRTRAVQSNNRLTIWTQQYLVEVTRTINKNRNVVQRLVGFNTVVRESDQPAESPSSVPFTTEVSPP